MYYIKVNNLSKKIKDNYVLKDINLKLEGGKIHSFIGRNGSGKTMLFRAISGLIKPTEGEVFIKGYKLDNKVRFPKSVGIIIESCGFWENYSAFENLKLLSTIKNIISDDDIVETLYRVGIDPRDKKKYKKYSLGMKQRLAIAQAIMEKPDLIILDEPTNSLDNESVDEVRKIILNVEKVYVKDILNYNAIFNNEEMINKYDIIKKDFISFYQIKG